VAVIPADDEALAKAKVPVRVGLFEKTATPPPALPVSSVKAEAKLALDGVPRKVATLAPRPETPVLIGRPVALDRVSEIGVPR
jgi:hypothetical protein